MLGLSQSKLVYWSSNARADSQSAVKRRSAIHDPLVLWRACDQGDYLHVHALFRAHPDLVDAVNTVHPVKGTTPLMAASKDRVGGEAVRSLLDHGADVRVVAAESGDTALHYAARCSDALATELLLAAGADAYAINAANLMPLDIARRCERGDVARVLTAVMQVHAGWIRLQTSSGSWDRFWAALIACNAAGSSTELCLFRSPTHTQPHAVLTVDGASRASESDIKSTRHGSKSPLFAFRLDRPVIMQELKHQRYSRDANSGRTVSHSSVKIRDGVFAADSATERDAWVAALTTENGESSHSGWSPFGQPVQPCNRSDKPEQTTDKCIICESAPRNAVCAPCGHLVACYPCLRAATQRSPKQCPICRASVHSILRVYSS